MGYQLVLSIFADIGFAYHLQFVHSNIENAPLTRTMMRSIIFSLIFLLLCGIVVSTDKVEQLEALVHSLKEEMVELKVRLDAKEQCECNLTDIEHDIRKNGIEIAEVRHTIVLNGEHVSENLDKIIELVDLDLQQTVADLADTKTRLEVRYSCLKTLLFIIILLYRI